MRVISDRSRKLRSFVRYRGGGVRFLGALTCKAGWFFFVSLPPPCSFPRTDLNPLITAGHIRSHNKEKPFQCHWLGCGKGFARKHDCKSGMNSCIWIIDLLCAMGVIGGLPGWMRLIGIVSLLLPSLSNTNSSPAPLNPLSEIGRRRRICPSAGSQWDRRRRVCVYNVAYPKPESESASSPAESYD